MFTQMLLDHDVLRLENYNIYETSGSNGELLIEDTRSGEFVRVQEDGVIEQIGVVLRDSSTAPSVDGEFRHDSSDVKVHSGGLVRNLSNMATITGGGSAAEEFTISDDDVVILTSPEDINAGTGLEAVDDGDDTTTLNVVGGGGSSVSDDDSEILSSPDDLNFASNLSVTDDGDNTVTIDASGGSGLTLVDSGTQTIDTSGGTFQTYNNSISGTVPSGSYIITSYVSSNESNIASGNDVGHTAQQEIRATVEYDSDGDGWRVHIFASGDSTTGPVDITWSVWDVSGGGSSASDGAGVYTGGATRHAVIEITDDNSNVVAEDTYYDRQFAISGGYLYTTVDSIDLDNDSNTEDWLVVFDISDPTNPSQVAKVESSVSLDSIHGIATDGNIVVEDGGAVFDVSTPTSPTEAGTWAGDGAYGGGVMGPNGDYAYFGSSAGINIIDVSDPSNPSRIYRYESNLFDAIGGITRHGNRLYTSSAGTYGGSNMAGVLDISDPTNPVPLQPVAVSNALAQEMNKLTEYDGTYLYHAAPNSGNTTSNYTGKHGIHVVETDVQTLSEDAASSGGGGLSDSRTWSHPVGIDVTDYTQKVQITGVDDLTNDGVQKVGTYSVETGNTVLDSWAHDPSGGGNYAIKESGDIERVNSDLDDTVWSTSISGADGAFEVVAGSGSDVYAAFHDSTADTKTLHAFDKDTGSESWSATISSTYVGDAHLSVDSSNNIYVDYWDGSQNSLKKFDSSGSQVASSSANDATSSAVSPNFFYALDSDTSPPTLRKYDHSFTELASVTVAINDMYFIVADVDDNVYSFGLGVEKFNSSLSQQFFVHRGDWAYENPTPTPDGIMVYSEPSNPNARQRTMMLDYSDGSELYNTGRFLHDGTLAIFSYAGTPAAFPSNF